MYLPSYLSKFEAGELLSIYLDFGQKLRLNFRINL